MPEKRQMIKLDPKDNVVVVLGECKPGASLDNMVLARDLIPAGHKAAVQLIEAGAPVIKYGQVMGFAARDILPGGHVHTHNVELRDFGRDYAIGKEVRADETIPESERAVFEGFVRPDGRVGTRNYIGILPTVNCSAGVARFIADKFPEKVLKRFPNVDGVVALSHGDGCCDIGEGLDLLRRTMSGYASHPNFGGVLLVGLGCEINLVEDLLPAIDSKSGASPSVTVIQNWGGTEATVRQGVYDVNKMLEVADRAKRTCVPADRLVVGLECGGSDAYSGISANPAMGKAVDLLVRHGGTAVLSETPEIYGAEHLLTRRAVRPEVGQKLIDRIQWWESYAARNGAEINNNPSPGNKAGGITTILEKSLGAIAKAGSSNLMEVYRYAEQVTSKGLVFMDTPGYDPVSVTGMIAGGANLICFTTGRGSVYGSKPVPTLKLASNSPMFQRMSGDMDVNCGLVIDGRTTLEEMGGELFQIFLDTASGKKTGSETLGFGDNEFVPWRLGAVL